MVLKSEDVTGQLLQLLPRGCGQALAVKLKTKLRLIFSGAGGVSMEERRAMLAKYRSPGKKKKKQQQRTVARHKRTEQVMHGSTSQLDDWMFISASTVVQ